MKSIAVVILLAALLYSDAQYVIKFGADYEAAGVVGTIFFIFLIVFMVLLGLEGRS